MDRKEAIERIKRHMIVHQIGSYPHIKLAEALNMAIAALQEPEIVRCKDCKHWIDDYPYSNIVKKCELAGYMVGEKGYCVYGQKLGEEE